MTLYEYLAIRMKEELSRSRSPISLGRVEAFKEIARVTADMQIEIDEDDCDG